MDSDSEHYHRSIEGRLLKLLGNDVNSAFDMKTVYSTMSFFGYDIREIDSELERLAEGGRLSLMRKDGAENIAISFREYMENPVIDAFDVYLTSNMKTAK